MAKKVDGYEAFLADVLATVPEDRRSMIEETFKNDAIRSELEKGYLRQSDFSRAHDNLRAERENFQHTVEEANTRINGWQEWYTNASGEYETMRAENQRLVALDGTDQRPVVQGMSQEDVTALLEARDRQAIAFADILTDLKLDHNKQFNEKLNTNELVTYATRRGVPLDVAYREYVAPRMDKIRSEELDAKLAKAREEGAREALSKHRLPVVNGPLEQHVLDRASSVKTDSNDRVNAAVERWNNAPHSA
jgi:hypothetical protein